MSAPIPFPSFAAPSVKIIAAPIARGWRFSVQPQGRCKVTAYTLRRAREVARRYSRRVVEIGPFQAFNRRAAR